MRFQRGADGSDPVPSDPTGSGIRIHDERRTRATRLGVGTLACPHCDAPVALAGPVAPADPIGCPYCGHAGAVRDFLSLAPPSRPARVVVRVVTRRRRARS